MIELNSPGSWLLFIFACTLCLNMFYFMFFVTVSTFSDLKESIEKIRRKHPKNMRVPLFDLRLCLDPKTEALPLEDKVNEILYRVRRIHECVVWLWGFLCLILLVCMVK